MASEGLEDMFEGDIQDTCGDNFAHGDGGGKQTQQASTDRERRLPSVQAEFCYIYLLLVFVVVHACDVVPCADAIVATINNE